MTREKAIEILKEIIDEGWLISDFEKCVAIDACEMAIKALEQEPRKGHWIFKKTVFDRFGNTVECSSCHKKWKTYDEIRWKKENKYCPNCGAEMEGEDDSN